MGESDNEGARAAERTAAERERHEKTMQGVIDRFRTPEFNFLRPGERIDPLPLEEGAKDCLACCEAVHLGDKESVAERTRLFPSVLGDALATALQEAGYRVVVDYDQEKSTGDVDCLRYSLYEKEK